MGADMLLWTLPYAAGSSERQQELERLVRNLPDVRWREVAEEHGGWLEEESGSPAQWGQELLLQAVLNWSGLPQQRDVVVFYGEGMTYRLLVTGGLSWGDSPTDAAEIFEALGAVHEIWLLLRDWAIEDLAAEAAES
jgi:hypothetical protein